MNKICLISILSLCFIALAGCKDGANTTSTSAAKPAIEKALKLSEALGNDIVFDWAERSYSPMYSNIGLVFSDYPGIPGLYFHYNYRNKGLKRLLTVPDSVQSTEATLLGIHQVLSQGELSYAFYDQNSFLIEVKGYEQVPLLFDPPTSIPIQSRKDRYEYTYQPWVEEKEDYIRFRAFMPNRDARDPDPFYPIAMGVKILEGASYQLTETGIQVQKGEGRILLALSLQAGGISEQQMAQRLAKAPQTIAAAREMTATWLNRAVGDLPLFTGSKREQQIAAKAAMALTFNACVGNGYLAEKVATFPNRGNYATQYEWDAAFQNLAYEMMEPRLAEDAISILTESQRPDGKIGQFVTSTYLRPVEVQVPLTGWSTERLYRRRGNKAFIRKVLPRLVKNSEWILHNRMTRYGLTSALSPWELWDDTPRLDSGAILACDFNADLLMQIRACEFLAREIGDIETANASKALGDTLGQRLVEVLYDEEANIFRDVLVSSGKPMSILTPANFVPLLAGVPIPEDKAKAMIQTYLLDSTKFFGAVPFPSVAYDEPTYQPHKPGKPKALTWRGPTWMPMAWMMLEVLKKYEFKEAYWQAANRIYALMLQDGELHELFNSQTGEGIGIPQLGWTAAIFLKLKMELEANGQKRVPETT